MKFTGATLALAAVAAAAPAVPGLGNIPTVPEGASSQAPYVDSVITCDYQKAGCHVQCGDNLQNVCTIVETWDSAWFGLESLAGAQLKCDNNGCQVYCAKDGTAYCAANEALGAFDGVWAKGEDIGFKGVTGLLGNKHELLSKGFPLANW